MAGSGTRLETAEADGSAAPPAPSGGERVLSAAAGRALAEAAARRTRPAFARSRELNGRDGPNPTRYGDWEVRGLASDF